MKTRILTRESMTPIEPYLTNHRERPDDYDTQIAFAVNLIVREWDHSALTMSAEKRSNRDEIENEDGTLDPFGLKGEAAESLGRCLKPKARFSRGYLLLLKLLHDLTRWEDLVTVGRECAPLMPKNATAWAFVHAGAVILTEEGRDSYKTISNEAIKAARKIIGPDRTSGMLWSMRVIGEFESGLYDWSRRIRAKVEGESFTRALKTENDLLREARKQNVIDKRNVPAGLRSLAPLAERWGIGDDVLRVYALSKLKKKERLALIARTGEKVNEISACLDSFDGTDMPKAAAAFMYLLSARDEIDSNGLI